MKFKVGDKVRLKREFIANHEPRNNLKKELIIGTEIQDIDKSGFTKILNNSYWSVENLELVPEKPEFEFGEEIEIFRYDDKIWKKAIFITKIPGNVGCSYACVHRNNIDEYKKGYPFEIELWRTARKLRPQLTRKEIAEKFGVSEDFTLVD